LKPCVTIDGLYGYRSYVAFTPKGGCPLKLVAGA